MAARTTYRSCIREWRELASRDDIFAGRDWYPFARLVAHELAAKYSMEFETVAGIIAVLSPQTKWDENLKGAETLIRAYAAGEGMPGPGKVETTRYANVRKAWAIAQYGARGPGRTDRIWLRADYCRSALNLKTPGVWEPRMASLNMGYLHLLTAAGSRHERG